MAQVATTCGAGDLCARHAVTIVGRQHHCARDGIVKAWPATMSVEFGATFEQLRAASAAAIRTGVEHTVVLTAKRRLGALFAQHMVLLGRQLVLPLGFRFINLHILSILVDQLLVTSDSPNPFSCPSDQA